MPLDDYKTQVLLLHSEQSTLDSLSSGFSERYTVHCATSGSEALNTLVDTPINVIISAHDLPGMSGLDALREAKKRSPETIGILLAGNKTPDVEALVSEEEVFQVVSGQVTGDGLLQLVDNATRQMRLVALAESANDTTADVDKSAEHIIMETSENGSTIISDGTGRMPILDPKKVAASAIVGSQAVDVLVLTKDHEFLQTIKDSSRGMHDVFYANTLGQANEAIRNHKIGVAVVDAAMVGEKIEQLTEHLRKASPRLVSIVAGRRDDGEMLMDLINRGKVYRFLLKPVSPGRARLAVESSVKHHLEAPETAFKTKGVAATADPAAAKPAMKRRPAAPQTAQKPAPRAASKPATPVDPPFDSVSASMENSPIEDGLADAFGQDDSSFTETVTGLISSVGKRFSSDSKTKPISPSVIEKSVPKPDRRASLALDGGSGKDGRLKRHAKTLGFVAVAVVIAAAAAFWLTRVSDNPTPLPNAIVGTPSEVESAEAGQTSQPEFVAVDPTVILEEARLARDAGQIFNPDGNNAIELFATALNADSSNASIAAEFDAVISQALGMAESAMLESRLDDSQAALNRVTEFDAQNVRLPFLTAQQSQMQLRRWLDEARLAIREVRFEDAATSLAAAGNLDVADTTEIDTVAAELATARSEQKADDVLAKAAARVDTGDLISPANDNARYYYELVLSNDPENVAARQGLGVVAGKLAFQARTEMDSGNLQEAEDILGSARALDPENAEVAATITALASARAAIAQQQRRAEANRQAAAKRRAEEERQAELDRQAKADQIAAEKQAAEVSESLSPATDVAAVETAEAESSDVTKAAPETATADQTPIAISSLTRTKYVAPKYPRAAQRRNLSGWVDVVFVVTTEGTVKDIGIRNSEPGDTFVNSAIKAAEKWQFEPIVEDGAPVEKLVGVRMMFALE